MNTARATIQDLIIDVRFSERMILEGHNVAGNVGYMETCRKQIRTLFANRHPSNFKMDRYGWPLCLSDQS